MQPDRPQKAETTASATAWPKDWSNLLGQAVTLEGTAADAKLGALLVQESNGAIWIDDLESWPNGYYLGGDKGKHVRVTGTVIERYDLPVFIQKEGEPLRAGIAVPPGTDLKKASRRFLLKDAKT
jgi:hypothetical protein